MNFNDEMVSQEYRYAIGTVTSVATNLKLGGVEGINSDGQGEKSKKEVSFTKTLTQHYLSIPTTNGTMDYEEYYEITEVQFKSFSKNPWKGATFAQAARARESEDLLIIKPGRERGWAQ